MSRISSLGEFWPYYLSEHSHPVSRVLHFFGTTGFFLSVAASLAQAPVTFGIALGLGAVSATIGALWVEPRRAAFLPMLGLVVPLVAVAPLTMIPGIVGAYAAAWIGHFRFEHNRPATFRYPVWSFLCDFRMWSHMARGRWWSGEARAVGTP
jgi:hypothetical protein